MSRQPTIPGTIAVVQLQPIVSAYAAMGGDVARVLARAGLSADELADSHARAAAGVEFALWDAVEEVSGDPLIGVRIAEHCMPSSLGGFGYLMRNCATMREAIAQANRFERVLDDLTRISVFENGDEAAVRVWRVGGYPHPARGLECVFSVLLRVGRSSLPGVAARGVRFAHRAPADVRAFAPFFGCPVWFEQSHDELVFASAVLDLPQHAADPALAGVLAEHMQVLLDALPTVDPFVHRARGLLLQALQSGSASLEALAEALHVSPRTLRRRLEEHGTSYKALLDELRRDLAFHYLGRSAEPPDVVAGRLGFTEASTFYRAFKRWSGTTPALYRERARSGAGNGSVSS